jgi:hypothetical protein
MRKPAMLRKGLSPTQQTAAERWWASLAAAQQRSLGVPRERALLVGRFVEPAEPEESTRDLYEYLVNHELWLEDGRPYFICTAHAGARKVLRRGRIPATFRCPRAERACPMRAILDAAGGRDVRLEVIHG